MADIYGSHFEYAGVSSRLYGLMIASAGTSRFTQLSGSIKGNTVFNRTSKKQYLIDDDYSDFPVSFEIDIVTDDDRAIELNERRKIEKWLFNRHNYRKLYLDIEDDCLGETYEIIDGEQKRLYLNCRFVNPERIESNDGIAGYHVTLEADSGLWWQDAVTQLFTITPQTPTIIVHADTDIDDYIYPKVTVQMGDSGGDLTIINETDDNTRQTKFVGLGANLKLTINGEINYVSGNNETNYYQKFSIRNFPRILDGDNSIAVTGDVSSITFEYSNRRML